MCNIPYGDFTLLVDGKEAFPAILQAIDQAEVSLVINMFIWRDDGIGNRMAEAVLRAAERGVKVQISVDRYGVVLEKSEEARASFFHKKQTFTERLKSSVLSLLYPMPGAPRRVRDQESDLYRALLSHPNITIEKDTFRADHSKFYIIDGKILFLGGINIEDKENGADMQGRVYRDYMVQLDGKPHVDAFLAKLNTQKDIREDYFFGIHRKRAVPPFFEMESQYLRMINCAQRELMITMAYFSPLPQLLDAIVAAHARGVQVTVLIPAHANYQSDSNKKAVRRLLQRTSGGITVYLSPDMHHTKLIATEKEISLGSTNLTKKAFAQLDELNLFVKNIPCPFVDALLASVRAQYALATPVTDYRTIRYNRLFAFFEGFLV